MATSRPLSGDPRGPRRVTRRRAGLLVCGVLTAGAVAGAIPSSAAPAAPAPPGPDVGIAAVVQRVDQLDRQAELAAERFDAAQIAVTAARRDAAAARVALGQQQGAVAALSSQAARLVSASYEGGGSGALATFTDASDPSAYLDRASLVTEMSDRQSAGLAVLRAQQQRLDDAEAAAVRRAAMVQAAVEGLQSRRASVEALLQDKQRLLAGLQGTQRTALAVAQAAAEAEARQQQAVAVDAAQALVRRTTFAAGSAATGSSGTGSTVVDGTSGVAAGPVRGAGAAPSGFATAVLAEARRQVGKPYVFGAAGPAAYDCSGLTMWAFAHAGVSLPHNAAAQYGFGRHVSLGELLPGDLVFFGGAGGIDHEGIYVGGGAMIDAPHSGTTVGLHALYSGFVGGTRI